ncbi:phenoloxidase-activating factor 2 isoform X2 [Drosophila innubila]|uniref:phenoloxidase-activating factor 2 isoform X2 n=1 Tax=Drosophila innubila TaxID=198719 RepID=UPI00148E72F2|nr:phenoloxidase-activating factor 2 isoform X2 [Drosophila innubila]
MMMSPTCCFQSLFFTLLIVVQNRLTNGEAVISVCGTEEMCVTEKLCIDSDDSGRGLIGIRIARICGIGLVCCDREQLESWNATLTKSVGTTQRNSQTVNTTTTTEEPSGYESCGLNMECVPRKLCQDNVINDDGHFIVNPRIGETPCRRALDRCCAIDQQAPANESSYLSALGSFKYQGCGWSNPKGLIPDQDNYEYATDVSLFAEFPWMVALITGRNQYVCGGTLIHPQLVLTSAHNIKNHTVHTLVARAGEWDLNSLDEPHEHQARRIKQIIPHEEFDPEAFFNDIALVVLDEPVEIKPHIQPLCLPPPETPALLADLRKGQCYATGWGSRLPGSDRNERLLKRIDLPVVSRAECQAQLRVTRLGRRFRLRPSFICAGGIEGKDTCKGDGGSPLFCTLPGQSDRYQLAGIVSWGIECAKEDVPAVYANVPFLRTWIDEKVKSLGLKIDGP